ncbi:MAG: hypothetical protein LBU32_01350 [Clostridiales bacterium]|nr:hypothetical protein [Clostridiales bacterium]
MPPKPAIHPQKYRPGGECRRSGAGCRLLHPNSRCPEYFSRRKAEVIDMVVDEITTEQYIELQTSSLKREARKHAEKAKM